MPKITDGPNTYDFGLDFNYAVWTQGTHLSLVNVPWNNDYRDVVKFDTAADLDAYIDGLENAGISLDNLSYVKPNNPIRIPIPFNAAYKYNYIRATNPTQPITGDVNKSFYYFITDVRYVAPNTTEIVVQLDVWQTFIFQAQFGNCYIERGHIGIANENAFDNYGRTYLTIPEGIDVGSEYQMVAKRNKPIMQYDLSDGGSINTAKAYDILIVSTVDLLADPGSASSPSLKTAGGGNFFGAPSGANYYVFNGNDNSFQNYLTGMSAFPWVTQGIISVTVIPPVTRYIPNFVYGNGLPVLAPTQVLTPLSYAMFSAWRQSADVVGNIPTRYAHLLKMFTFPYMMIQLTTFTGTPVVIKPENWTDPDATVVERISPIPPNMRIAISPWHHNVRTNGGGDPMIPGYPASNAFLGDDYGDYIDVATQISNFPTFAVVNNMAIAYLAANAHGIAYQYQAADWAQTRALGSNMATYDNANTGIDLANQLTQIGINRDTSSTGISNDLATQRAIVNGIGSIAGGISGGGVGIAGGVGSAAMGGIGAAMDINAANQQLATRNAAANQSNRASVGAQGSIRDTNKGLADWAAKGDYQNQVAGINAKVQDARLTQPSISGQVGGEAMNLINNNMMVSMRIKMIDQAAIRVVGEYWLRYGYAIHQFAQLPANLMVMTKFTYWKLTETYISSATMPETYKQTLRGIMEKGVTVWANPADIGNIDIADNAPLEGITL